MPIEFDFSELRGLIIARFGTLANFAEAIHMGRAQLSLRLNNKTNFKPEDIHLICSPAILDIQPEQIGKYFFTPKV